MSEGQRARQRAEEQANNKRKAEDKRKEKEQAQREKEQVKEQPRKEKEEQQERAQKEKEKEKARVQPQRNKRHVLRDETDSENDVDILCSFGKCNHVRAIKWVCCGVCGGWWHSICASINHKLAAKEDYAFTCCNCSN